MAKNQELSLADELALMLDDWLGGSSNRSLGLLCKRSGVPYSTVYRLSTADSPRPSFDAVAGVLSVVAESFDHMMTFLQKHYPAVCSALRRQVPLQVQQSGKVCTSHSVLDEMMGDQVGFVLAQQILSSGGISEDRVAQLYGEYGLGWLSRLRDLGDLVAVSPGVWRFPLEYVNLTLEGNKDQVRSALSSWSMDSHATGLALLETRSDGVTLDGAAAIKELLQDTLCRVQTLREQHPGPHVFIANVLLQLADPKLALQEIGAQP